MILLSTHDVPDENPFGQIFQILTLTAILEILQNCLSLLRMFRNSSSQPDSTPPQQSGGDSTEQAEWWRQY